MSNYCYYYFFFFILSCSVSLAKVSTVFLFGDSILDAGNNRFNKNCSVQADFPPYGQDFFHHPTGRFTNGRTVGDFIAEALGIELQMPYLEAEMMVRSGKMEKYPGNGMNFASAGGFVNVSGACCGGGALRGLSQCGVNEYELRSNPKQYIFWDSFHPSQHAYKLIFRAAWNGKPPMVGPMNLRSLVNHKLHAS